MRFSRTAKISCSLFMSLLLTHIPNVVVAAPSMITTSTLVEKLDKTQAQKDVVDFLTREDVKKNLEENGISPDEISSRIASLSEQELRDLSGQIKEARAGGDILVTILVIILIIYFVKRI